MTDTMRNKAAVITGASSGIGRGIALHFAKLGWDIAFTFVDHEAAASEVSALAGGFGRRVLAMRCDAGIKSDVDRFYKAVEDWCADAPDLLVNNAGVQTWAPLLELEESDWDRVVQINLKGCFLNTQSVARLMLRRQKHGAIVNIGSGCNKLAFPKLIDYGASKGGIEQLTKTSAVELGPYGIRVNCVAPGAILIERTALEAPDYAKSWSSITPLRRIGTVEDVAKVVQFFASDDSSFVSGQTIWVDGAVFSQAAWPCTPS